MYLFILFQTKGTRNLEKKIDKYLVLCVLFCIISGKTDPSQWPVPIIQTTYRQRIPPKLQ